MAAADETVLASAARQGRSQQAGKEPPFPPSWQEKHPFLCHWEGARVHGPLPRALPAVGVLSPAPRRSVRASPQGLVALGARERRAGVWHGSGRLELCPAALPGAGAARSARAAGHSSHHPPVLRPTGRATPRPFVAVTAGPGHPKRGNFLSAVGQHVGALCPRSRRYRPLGNGPSFPGGRQEGGAQPLARGDPQAGSSFAALTLPRFGHRVLGAPAPPKRGLAPPGL